MKSILVLLILAGGAFAQAPAASSDRHVVLITLDGMAAYNLDDNDLVIPNIRALARAGVQADSSETVFPSVTHPSHTTIVTGVLPIVHGVLGNSMHDRVTGKKFDVSDVPHSEIVHAPTIFDLAKKHGLTTAAFDWPESKDDASIDYNLPDTSQTEVAAAAKFSGVGRPLHFNPAYHHDIVYQGATDLMVAEAAAETIRQHRPNLIAIHFLKTDVAQHTYGPGHYLAKAAITESDRHIGLLRDAVRAAGIEKQTTFIIAADHGFQAVTEEINLHGPIAEAGLAGRLMVDSDKWVLHIARGKTFTKSDEPRLAAMLDRIARLPGIARVVASAEYPSMGFPRYEDDVHVRGEYMVIATLQYHLADDPSNSATTPRIKAKPYFGHGYLPQNPRMYPMLVLSGRDIAQGKRMGHVRNLDIAPTMAHLLGFDWAPGPGHVLAEALDPADEK